MNRQRTRNNTTDRNLFFMLTSIRSAVIIVTMPVISLSTAQEDSWASAALAMMFSLPLACAICWASSKIGTVGMISSLRASRRLLGVLLVLPYIAIIAAVPAFFAGQLSSLFVSVALSNTPQGVLVTASLLFGAYAASLGLGTLGRLSQPVFVLLLFLVALTIVGTLNSMDSARLLPRFARGVWPLLHTSIVPLAWTALSLAVIPMLHPNTSPSTGIRNAALYSVVVSGVMLTLASAVVIMVFSAQEARELLSPMYHLAKNIRVPHVLDRLEVAVLSAWIGVLCLKIALFLHAASRALADLFGLRRHEPFIFPLAAVNLALAQTLFAEEPSVRARVAVVLPIVAVILILTPVLAALITKAETKGDTRYAK